ncbi:MAG: hypothetical protein A2186_02115 [Candidatus Levybacteria bacterium RIFOXYA1_FULL_41_10]|nr:MAG: hypothetical protein A2186_02115 [Candidatus Levybacteria bacterium RIFOXYA1_FULL_41_10]
MPKYMAGKIKDGFITGVFCMGYSAILILVSFLEDRQISAMALEDLLLIPIFIAGLFLILREQLMPKIRDLK